MKIIHYGIVLIIASVLSGCSITDIRSSIKGNYYMQTGDYITAEKEFRLLVETNPENALSHYYLGRFLLAQKKSREALSSFQKGAAKDPTDTDINFWLGVAYGEQGDLRAEREQYERTLNLNSGYVKARLYLGHSQLRSGELDNALNSYDKVLESISTNAAALYNRALILDLQGKRKDAKEGWLEYLEWFPAGGQAIRATEHLNDLGDYSYENHFIGPRTVTLKKISFKKQSDKVSVSSIASLRLVGTIVNNLERGDLQIVVYEEDYKKSAHKRALALRDKILEITPELNPQRVSVSWFNHPEVYTQNGRKHVRKSSVRLFLTDWK